MICDYLAEKIGFKQGLIFTAILRLQIESYYTTNTSASVVDYNKQIKFPNPVTPAKPGSGSGTGSGNR